MNLINRTVGRALADARADERAEKREAERAVITVRRLPGSTCWDIMLGDVVKVSSPRPQLDAILDLIRRAGGRAEVVYDDQDSITDRLKRQQEGRQVARLLNVGDFLFVRWNREGQAYEPCEGTDPHSLRLGIVRVDHEAVPGKLVFRSGLLATIPVNPHAVLKLAPLPTVES